MANTATNQQQLSFLQEKISEIGSAIFFNLSDSVLKLPTSVVTVLRVDDYGFVWFLVQKPKQSLQEFEMEFPARLDFYKKGKSYFLQVSGKGCVVNEPEDIQSVESIVGDSEQWDANGMVLVKVKILKAEYYETRPENTRQSWWQSAINACTAWFRSNNHYRPDVYYPRVLNRLS